jgi:glutamate racemase
MKIGVFDSGVGGKSVADALKLGLPGHEILFINDADHLPYGSKTPQELKLLVHPHLQYLVDQGCEIIVVACNTVSCTVLPEMKSEYPVEIVGIVPMIKPASLSTKTGVIAVCATPTTLGSKRYAELKHEFADGIQVLEPDCSDWALMIEANQLDQQKIRTTIDTVCEEGADVIVLGCTHYHWIEDVIRDISSGRAEIIQPESAILERVQSLIAQIEGDPLQA